MTTTTVPEPALDLDFLDRRLRAITAAVEWIDEHAADLPAGPGVTSYSHSTRVHLSWHLDGDEQKDDAATIVRIAGGNWTKDARDDIGRMTLEHRHSDDLAMTIFRGPRRRLRVWETPAPPGTKPSVFTATVRDALRSRPGDWALLTPDAAIGCASNWRVRFPEFEFTTRHNGGRRARIYARYVEPAS